MTSPISIPDASACERFYDERYARGYMDDWPARKLERVGQLIVKLGLPDSGTALDWGCGNGLFTCILRGCLPDWRIIGLDISRTAIANARHLISACEFHHVDEADVAPGSVDFLFTHHVLEHVPDLDESFARIAALMKPRSHMLHILPCGNAGSFEHDLCQLRSDGIDATRGGRFFYEDEAHLRRLTTDQLAGIAKRFGFELAQSWYSHHDLEAIDWLTGNGVRFVLELCNPSHAIDATAARRLAQLRRRLLGKAIVKSIARKRASLMRPVAIIAQRLISRWASAADREWQKMQSQPNGSEMYLAFQRQS